MVCVGSAGRPVFLDEVNRQSMFPLPFQSDTRKMTPRVPIDYVRFAETNYYYQLAIKAHSERLVIVFVLVLYDRAVIHSKETMVIQEMTQHYYF
jgi:hypothetical protein